MKWPFRCSKEPRGSIFLHAIDERLPDLNPSGISTGTRLLTLSTLHFFGFYCNPMSSIPSFIIVKLVTPRGPSSRQCTVDLRLWTLPFLRAYSLRWSTVSMLLGFKHNVNKRGHRASPWDRHLLKLITGKVTLPTLVLVTILVFHAAHTFLTTSQIQTGNLRTSTI